MTKRVLQFLFSLTCLAWLLPASASAGKNVSVVWDFNSAETYADATISDPDAISFASFNLGSATVPGTEKGSNVDVTFTKVQPANGQDDTVEWFVKPASGVTFTPTRLSAYIQRFGTDAEDGVKVSVKLADGTLDLLGTYTAARNKKTQSEDKFGSKENYTQKFDIALTEEQQTKYATKEGFTLVATIGVPAGKQGGFCDVRIEGIAEGLFPGTTLTNESAEVIWDFNTADFADVNSVSPEGAFAITAFDINGNSYNKIEKSVELAEQGQEVSFAEITPVNGASDYVTWSVKPAKGLTFTPTKLSAYIARVGTDAKSGMNISAQTAGGEIIKLGTFTAHRINKKKADDKYGNEADYATRFDFDLTTEQQQQLTTAETFSLIANLGVGAGKSAGFSDVHIAGILNGTVEAVAKHSLTTEAVPAGAAIISLNPAIELYDEGTEVSVSATRNFGYQFVNWTDGNGKVVSEEPTFKYTVNSDSKLYANYNAINTYELVYNVVGGANKYMVQPTPAPTVVDGKNMYEEGTTVTLTASSNPVVTFTNWSDGQSSGEISIVMDSDKSITANYSAIDYVAGWDFYRPGSNGRVADYYSADNDAAALNLRNAEGKIEGWLDKSQEAAGGYEGRPAAVNWRTYELGEFYWETKVNASAFTDMKLITAMLYNYNAYTTYNVEYSLDGNTWEKLGDIVMEGAKSWTDVTLPIPAAANNQPELSIRWIADKNSTVAGTDSKNDGAALGASFIIGTEKLIDDGKAPVLVSFIPEEGSTSASINGKIVLTFDEKVKVADGAKATINDTELIPEVTGKTVLFQYKNLSYGTKYTFNLPGNSVSDLTDNAVADAIKINFTTKTRPAVAKAEFDFIVPDDGSIHEAIAAAEKREDTSKRFRVFIRNGFYKLPASTTAMKTDQNTKKEYPDPTTYLNTPNVSFIGESTTGVVITNTLPDVKGALEGIGLGDVLNINAAATNTYFQNLTMKSSMGDNNGRDIVLNDKSDKTIAKDICLWAYQDTYVSNNDKARYYFEGGVLRGRTDYLCGKGDVFYNAVTLQMCSAGGYLSAPSTPKQYGYVFKDCEITGESEDIDGNYYLGRPWGKGAPMALFIDTKMSAKPSAIGWNDWGTNYPNRMAEYNSFTANGTPIDLSQRRTNFDNHTNNPILTKEEAEAANYFAVMGGDDDWDPASLAEQAPAPANVQLDGMSLTWDDSDYALCWAVVEDGKVIAFTTEPSYPINNPDAVYAVRAANEMGGLGEAVLVGSTSIDDYYGDSEVVSTVYYNLEGMRVNDSCTGIMIKVDTLSDGTVVTSKIKK